MILRVDAASMGGMVVTWRLHARCLALWPSSILRPAGHEDMHPQDQALLFRSMERGPSKKPYLAHRSKTRKPSDSALAPHAARNSIGGSR